VLLYDMLLHLAPSPVTRLHRAIALRYTAGPQAAMTDWTPSPARWTATTCTTPPAPSCCASSATPTRPAQATGSPWS
jgi:hypothetical protein